MLNLQKNDGMSTIFVNKYTKQQVRIIDLCDYIEILADSDFSYDENPFIEQHHYNDDCFQKVTKCIYCRNLDTNVPCSIPFLQFLNDFEPLAKSATDALLVLEKIKTISNDETNQEDIRPLHSGESENNNTSAPSGVQEEGVEVPGVSLCDSTGRDDISATA